MPEDRSYSFDPLSEKIDLAWSGKASDEKKFNNYYDYFFSGEDIKVYIDGLFEEEYELDLNGIAYSVSQEKQPLYGFWSYNYDAVMYGTRIISGEFTIFTRYPRRMTELIELATQRRMIQAKSVKRNPAGPISKLRQEEYSKEKDNLFSVEDEKNVGKYWAYSQLDRITNDPFSKNIIDSNKNIFSAHPPFNFVIVFGLEEVASSPKDFLQSEDKIIKDNFDRMIVTDVNERLVKPNQSSLVKPMKVIIQEVQLLRMSTAVAPGGIAMVENYQFMARDFYYTEVDLGFIKKNEITFDSSIEAPQEKETTTTTTTTTNKRKRSGNRTGTPVR